MPLWMGAPDYLVNALQVQQLNAARVVCGYHSYYWSTTKLLNTCGWLSIKQQMVASTATMAHNIITTGIPRNIHANIVSEYPYRTRQATGGNIRFDGSVIGEKTFKFQAIGKSRLQKGDPKMGEAEHPNQMNDNKMLNSF